MPNKLKNLKITAVALCKQGANPDAHIMLYKSLDNKGGKVMKTLEEILKSLTPEDMATVNAEIEKAKANATAAAEDAIDGGMDDAMENPDGTLKDPKKKKPFGKVCQKMIDMNATIAKLQGSVTKSDAEKQEELFKSMPEAIQKSFKAMQDQVAASAAIAKKLEEESVAKVFIEKAKLFKSIPATVEDLGEILKSVDKIDKTLSTKLEGIFTATDNLISKGSVLKTVGKNYAQTTAGTALEALNKKAAEYVGKTGVVISKEQAFAKAMQDNPDLYLAYKEELLNDEE